MMLGSGDGRLSHQAIDAFVLVPVRRVEYLPDVITPVLNVPDVRVDLIASLGWSGFVLNFYGDAVLGV